MVKVISVHKDASSTNPPVTEEHVKNFLTYNNGRLLIHIGIVDEKGEPNVFPTGYYFDRDSDKIYIATPKESKKVSNLRVKSIVSYCIDDPNPPYKGVRGKGKVKIHEEEDISHNMAIAKKLSMSRIGSLEDPMSKWLLSETEKGNEVILEITPSYYSTWDFGTMG
jgi:nitroimidazol reductase NimA-like FMN-containing flavoprotein (pyridoxamine 5'-phosphate oxidase superfamily)